MKDDIDTDRTKQGTTGRADLDAGTHSGTTGQLQRLRDLHDFKVADGYPDIVGWTVKGPNGDKFGKVHDLIVSTSDMRARYLDVEIEGDQHALIPIGTAQLDDDKDNVIVSGLTDYDSYPRFPHGSAISHDYEQQVKGRFHGGAAGSGTTGAGMTGASATGASATGASATGASAMGSNDLGYDHDHFNDQRLFQGREHRGNLAADKASTDNSAAGRAAADTHSADMELTGDERRPMIREEVIIRRRYVDDAPSNR